MFKFRAQFLVTIGVLIALLAVACAPAPAAPTAGGAAPAVEAVPAQSADEPVTLIYGRTADSASLDPGEYASGEDARVAYQIYDKLVDIAITEDGKSSIVPMLAESWETSEDGTQWTFHLRSGVQFHDGTPFNAESVVFNFDRQRDPSHAFFPQKQKFWASTFGDMIENVEAVDDLTVRFTLQSAFGPFLTVMASPTGSIASPTAIQAYGVDFGLNPVGTGPFKFVEWVSGDRIVLERNDEYWGEPAKVDRVIFRSITDSAARYAELQAGSIDIAIDIDPDRLEQARQDPALNVLYRPSMNVGFVYINIAHPPFDNPQVRLALAHAIDKQAIVDAFYAGTGQTAKVVLPPSVWGYNDSIVDYPYDPEKAKQLLAEAGYPDGFQTTLWVMPVSRPYFPKPKEIGEAIHSYLTAIGIQAEIVSFDWTTYLAKTDAGEADLFMYGQTNTPDPHNFLYWFFGETSPKNSWNDPEVQQVLADAAVLTSIEERAALYMQAQELLFAGVPAIPIAHSNPSVLTRANVENFVPSPTDYDPLSKVEVTR